VGGLARRHPGASVFDPTPGGNSGQSFGCNPIPGVERSRGTFASGVNVPYLRSA